MNWTPNKWLAAFLGTFLFPFGMLYVGRWTLTIAYFSVAVIGLIAELKLGSPVVSPALLALMCGVHSYRVAKAATPAERRPWFTRWYGMLGIALSFFIALAVPRALLVEPFRTPTVAMEPTIGQGSFFLVSKIGFRNIGAYGFTLSRKGPSKQINRGSVVVFESPKNPDQRLIKRVVGLAGDTVAMKNKVLIVNGRGLKTADAGAGEQLHLITEEIDGVSFQTYINTERQPQDFEVSVPADGYFLVGDNRDASFDSRHFGPVRGEAIIGELVYVFQRERAK